MTIFLLPFLLAAISEVSFIDVAETWGVRIHTVFGGLDTKKYILETTGNGAAILDYDGDGRNDLLVLQGTRLDANANGPNAMLLFRNEGNQRFREVARAAGLVATGWAQGVCASDYDNDGRPDLLVTFYGTNRLFHNEGGRFTDVTASSGLPVTGIRWGAGCAFTDYNRDGLVDLFVSNYVDLNLKTAPLPGSRPECIWKDLPVMCGPRGLPMARNALYRNLGGGRFQDVSETAGIRKVGGRYGLGVVAADFNNDGWPDIYVACDQTPSLLFQNEKNGTFRERGLEAGVALDAHGRAQAGMGVAVADFNGDGFLDIAKTNFSGDLPSLYVNEDGEFFHDAAEGAGLGAHQLLGWGIAFVDADEDGWSDLVLANGHVYPEVDSARLGDRYRQPTLFYRNLGNGRFADRSAAAGAAIEAPKASRGLAVGDLDGDGRPEIAIVNMNEPLTLLRNETPRGNWLRVEFGGKRNAVGARVTVEAAGRKQMAELTSGNSYFSQHEAALYFGLGPAKLVDRLTVRWPLGRIQQCGKVRAGQTLRLVEGEPCPES